MASGRRGLTVMLHRDGALDSRRVHVSGVMLIAILVGVGAFLVGLLALVTLYAPIAGAAASVPGLKREIAQLEADNAKVRELVTALDKAEQRYAQLRGMLGSDLIPEATAFASPLPLAPPVAGRPPGTGSVFETRPSVPSHWPLDVAGYITRGQIGTNTRGEAHPGIDVAVPIGSVVRAAGGGRVTDAGEDPEYGWFVLIDHPAEAQSMYGHLSRITAVLGNYVTAGEVIGLSGNSGRSSAPHLHFEIRQEGRSTDPLDFVSEGIH
jgi:murein DD-endopeptidase MepM/ murein hydrolase activator NlpD